MKFHTNGFFNGSALRRCFSKMTFFSALLSISLTSLSLSKDALAEDDLEDGWLEDEDKGSEDTEVPTEGVDSAEVFRETQKRLKQMEPEEELIEWQRYLLKYPNTQYQLQIDKRIESLENILYNSIDIEEGTEEAGKKELDFAQPILLENIDPRKKLRFAFEIGLPDYINLLVDYEHPLSRELSVHGGLRKRYTGWSLEGGAKYALVKSTRTKSLVTAIGDVRINSIPFFVSLRPQISVGKILELPGNFRLDVMGQLGTELQANAGLQALLIGGFHTSFVAADNIRIFVEANAYMKDFFWKGKPFAFNTVCFGLKFRQKPKAAKFSKEAQNKFEGGLGATVPFQHAYWQYHYGSITADVNLY